MSDDECDEFSEFEMKLSDGSHYPSRFSLLNISGMLVLRVSCVVFVSLVHSYVVFVVLEFAWNVYRTDID